MKVLNTGCNNPMYGKISSFFGKTHTEESKLKNRLAHLGKKTRGQSHRAKKVIDISNNTIYDCALDAADANNLRSGTLVNMLTGHRVNKTSLKYL
jgi:butyrate kinase